MRTLFALFAASLLSACTGTGGETYLGRPGSPAWFATASPETIADHFVRRCMSYGFQPGTPQMAQCVQQEAGASRGLAANRARVALAGVAAPPSPTVRCTTVRQGVFLNTICN